MRYIFRHALSKAGRMLLYLIAYITASILIIAIWGLFYKSTTLSFRDSLIISFKLFYGLEVNTNNLNLLTIAFEYIFRDAVFVSWVGVSLSKLLSRVNPIYFSNLFTYDSKQEKISFRYWLMLTSGHYLYDIEIRVFVLDASKQTGRNHMPTLWKWESSEQHLSLARGIRYIDIIKEEDTLGLRKLLKGSDNELPKKVTVMIQGSDEDGKMYYRSKSYTISDCRDDQEFLSILKSEYSNRIPKENRSALNKVPGIQFHNFDKTISSLDEIDLSRMKKHKFLNETLSFFLNMDITGRERIKTRYAERKSKC